MQDPIGRRFRVQNIVQRSDQHRRKSPLTAVAFAVLQQEVVRSGQRTFGDPGRERQMRNKNKNNYRLGKNRSPMNTKVDIGVLRISGYSKQSCYLPQCEWHRALPRWNPHFTEKFSLPNQSLFDIFSPMFSKQIKSVLACLLH